MGTGLKVQVDSVLNMEIKRLPSVSLPFSFNVPLVDISVSRVLIGRSKNVADAIPDELVVASFIRPGADFFFFFLKL